MSNIQILWYKNCEDKNMEVLQSFVLYPRPESHRTAVATLQCTVSSSVSCLLTFKLFRFCFQTNYKSYNLSCNLLMCIHYAGSHSQNLYWIKQMNELLAEGVLFFCFFGFFSHRFSPSVLLQHVEDTMVISRLKWTVQTGGRVT